MKPVLTYTVIPASPASSTCPEDVEASARGAKITEGQANDTSHCS
jgi:hypothetical protein